MRKLLIVTLFSLIALSCKKKDLTFTIKGTISDATFSTSLKGAKLSFEEVLSSGSSEPFKTEVTIADDGTYEITFNRKQALKYILKVEKPLYFDVYEEISFSDFSTEQALVKNYQTTAKSWIKLTFVNQLPSSNTDQLRYIKQEGKANCSICCPISEQTITGKNTFSAYCVNDANTLYSVNYTIDNPYSYGTLSAITPAFDTVEVIKNW